MKTDHKHESLNSPGVVVELGLFRQEGDSAQESKALIEAARIIKQNPELYGANISQLEDQLAKIASGEADEGLIIETPDETASIAIGSEITIVARAEAGIWEVPSERFVAMVRGLAAQEGGES
jgi:hypothetical protein